MFIYNTYKLYPKHIYTHSKYMHTIHAYTFTSNSIYTNILNIYHKPHTCAHTLHSHTQLYAHNTHTHTECTYNIIMCTHAQSHTDNKHTPSHTHHTCTHIYTDHTQAYALHISCHIHTSIHTYLFQKRDPKETRLFTLVNQWVFVGVFKRSIGEGHV